MILAEVGDRCGRKTGNVLRSGRAAVKSILLCMIRRRHCLAFRLLTTDKPWRQQFRLEQIALRQPATAQLLPAPQRSMRRVPVRVFGRLYTCSS